MIKQIFNIKNILVVCVFILITYVVAILLKYDVLSGDDVAIGFFDKNIVDSIICCDHGRYLSCIQQKMITCISAILNVHPNTIVSTLGAYIRGFDIALMCFILALFPYVQRKTTNCMPLFMLLAFPFYMIQIKKYSLDELQYFDFHFGYCFGSLFYFAFLFVVVNIVLQNKVLSKLQLRLVYALAFLSSLNDTFAFNGIFFLFLLISYLFIKAFKKKEQDIDFKSFLMSFFEAKKDILIISATFICGACLSLLGMFTDAHVVSNIDSGASYSTFFAYWFDMIRIFLPQFFSELILRHYQILLCILVLFLLLIKSQTKNKKLKVAIVISMLFSMWLFFLSLITGGNNTFYEQGKFWISHSDIQLFYNMELCVISLMLFGFMSEEYANKIILKRFLFVISSVLYVLSFATVNSVISDYIDFYNNSKSARILMYKAEKMYLFYNYKLMPSTLPVSILGTSVSPSWWIGTKEDTSVIDEFEMNKGDKDWEKYNYAINEIKKINFADTQMINTYIKNIYKLPNPKPYKFDTDEKAYKYFTKKGGKFTDEELALENINFDRLLNRDFVLNSVDNSVK